MDTDGELPEGWAPADLGRVANLVSGAGFPLDEQGRVGLTFPFFKVGSLATVGEGELLLLSPDTIDEPTAKRLGAKLISPQSVVFAKIGMAIRLNRRRLVGISCCIDNNMMAAEPTGVIQPPYLLYFLRTVDFMPLSQATTVPSIRKGDLQAVAVLLPPFAEQRRIVAKAEELLSQVNAARARLARTAALLKRFRQSVLAAACDGRLTANWREDAAVDRGELPETWRSEAAAEFYDDARYGTSTKCDTQRNGGVPVLRVPNIASGQISLRDLKFGSLRESELDTLLLRPGDVLVCRTNGSVDLIGKAAVVPQLAERYAFASYLIRLRLDDTALTPSYFHLFLSSSLGRDQIEKAARTTAGQFNLNLKILGDLLVPVPPSAEQHEIVRRVDALFALAGAIESRVAAATARAERLTQSVLAKAFRGELVPTEAELARREGRDYEPASALLERIKSERDAEPPKANPRRKP